MQKPISSYFNGTFASDADKPALSPFTGNRLTPDELAFVILDGMARENLSVSDAKHLIWGEMDICAELHHSYLNAAKQGRVGLTGATRSNQAYWLKTARIMRMRLMVLQKAYNWLQP